MNFFNIFWPVIAIEHRVGPENVLFLFVGLQNGPHFLYFIVFLLAEGQLFLKECGDISWLIVHIDGWLERALLHFVLADFLLELFKFLTHLSTIDNACLTSILLIFFAYAELPVKDLFVFIMNLLVSGSFMLQVWLIDI